MTTAPKRRWFRFSLRGLLVVVTVLGCWLGWEVSAVHQRRSMAQRFEAEGGFVEVWTSDLEVQYGYEPGRGPKISGWRRWLGDRAYNFITLPPSSTKPDFMRARALFPEADIGKRRLQPTGDEMWK